MALSPTLVPSRLPRNHEPPVSIIAVTSGRRSAETRFGDLVGLDEAGKRRHGLQDRFARQVCLAPVIAEELASRLAHHGIEDQELCTREVERQRDGLLSNLIATPNHQLLANRTHLLPRAR